MHTNFGGPIGPFLDVVQQRQVPVDVIGIVDYAVMGSSLGAAEMEQEVQQRMLNAIRAVVTPKMASGELQFKDLGTGNVARLMPEIIGMCGLGQVGIAVGNLTMHFGIDGYPPKPLPVRPDKHAHHAAPQPQSVNVGGFKVGTTADGGIDTAGLKNQLVAKAKSTILWYAFFAGAVLLVLALVGGYTYCVMKKTPNPAAPAAAAKAETKPHPTKK
jgi:hypothetical protein